MVATGTTKLVGRRVAAALAAVTLAVIASNGLRAQETAAAALPDALQETYRDWLVRCEIAADAARLCSMSQELTQMQSGQRVLSVALRRGADGTAALTVIAPFGLRLADGVAIAVDGAALLAIPFRTCLPVGCVATTELDATTIDSLGAGTAAEVTLVSDGGEALPLAVSLAGFANAWARLGTLPEG
jgi:invasion protein IalB